MRNIVIHLTENIVDFVKTISKDKLDLHIGLPPKSNIYIYQTNR